VLTGLRPARLKSIVVRDEALGAYERPVDGCLLRLISESIGPQVDGCDALRRDIRSMTELYEIKGAWLTDYLIRAFNQDVPYDNSCAKHLAGDLLEKPRNQRP